VEDAAFKTVRAMDHLDHADPAAFIAAATGLGVRTVIIAWQEEYGQVPQLERINYQRLRQLWLLAYHRAGGVLLRCQLEGGADERGRLRRELEAAGLAVEERCRNIG
jgi:hypothetical protein